MKSKIILHRLKCGIEDEFLPNANQKFEIKIETNDAKV
jgi:hypothetical protein